MTSWLKKVERCSPFVNRIELQSNATVAISNRIDLKSESQNELSLSVSAAHSVTVTSEQTTGNIYLGENSQTWITISNLFHRVYCQIFRSRPIWLRPLFGSVVRSLVSQLNAADSRILLVGLESSDPNADVAVPADTIDCFCYAPVGRVVAANEVVRSLTPGCLLVLLMDIGQDEELPMGYLSSLHASPAHRIVVVRGCDVSELVLTIRALPTKSKAST
jgi:hypothetical protein